MSSDDREAAPVTEEDNLSFIRIIDADHAYITRLAGRIRKSLARLDISKDDFASAFQDTVELLEEATWRLIRHDLAEDLVMRPAFVQVLGSKGKEMAEHDRQDHAAARDVLLRLLSDARTLKSAPTPDALHEIASRISSAFDKLGEHMKVESGQFLPYFESVIAPQLSHELAKNYIQALVLTPYLKLLDGSRYVQGGFEQYCNQSSQDLKRYWMDIMQRADRDARLQMHLRREAACEVEALLNSEKPADAKPKATRNKL